MDRLDLSIKKITDRATQGDKVRIKGLRPNAPYYGGIFTVDSVGCPLKCPMCWTASANWRNVERYPLRSPEEVVEKIPTGVPVRYSAGEPTIAKEHLLKFLSLTDNPFLLETSGILLDENYLLDLYPYKDRIHIRVSLKGVDQESSRIFCGFHVYEDQLFTIERICSMGFRYSIALLDVFYEEWVRKVSTEVPRRNGFVHTWAKPWLGEVSKYGIDMETLVLYPFNLEPTRKMIEKLHNLGYSPTWDEIRKVESPLLRRFRGKVGQPYRG